MLLRNVSIVETTEAIFVVLKVYFVENLINEKKSFVPARAFRDLWSRVMF